MISLRLNYPLQRPHFQTQSHSKVCGVGVGRTSTFEFWGHTIKQNTMHRKIRTVGLSIRVAQWKNAGPLTRGVVGSKPPSSLALPYLEDIS